MYSVELYSRVRRACHVGGMSERAAARHFGIDRKTVSKILKHAVPPGYRMLRNFRVGIEAGISCLKRAYGLARCTWKGLAHFKAYVWSSVVAYNLALFARLKPA